MHCIIFYACVNALIMHHNYCW